MYQVPDVSRETNERLQRYVNLLLKWNRTINLISRSTIDTIWERHIADSLQIATQSVKSGLWVDVGSGGGLPVIPVAIALQEHVDRPEFVLMESDRRKAAFLTTVAHELSLPVTVLAERAETAPAQNASVMSARALSDLKTLLSLADRHLGPDGVAIFHKGANWQKEMDDARSAWSFSAETAISETDSNAVIVKIRDIRAKAR